MTKTDRAQRAGCTSRRLTDRALSCRPPVTLPRSDRRPPARVAYRCGRPAAGAPPRTPGRRPVSSNALLGGGPGIARNGEEHGVMPGGMHVESLAKNALAYSPG